jgi:hypothetical protein
LSRRNFAGMQERYRDPAVVRCPEEELMDTLQIQDAFAPYYADQPNVIESEPAHSTSDKRDLSEMRRRLESCRARLARAVAADGRETDPCFC